MSKSSELDKTIKRYIIDCIDGEAYGVELTTDAEKVAHLYNTFKAEYGWHIQQVGFVKALANYYSGLPTVCGIEFTYCDIIKRGREWGVIVKDSQEDRFCENWFNVLANKTAQLFRRYGHEIN